MRPIYFSLFTILFAGCQETRNDSPSVELSDVSGMIKGSPFQPDSVTIQERTLSFRQGKEFFADKEISFNLPIQAGDILAGGAWNFGGPKFRVSDPFLRISVKQGRLPDQESATPQDYSMTLTITKSNPKVIEGTIDLKVKRPEDTHLVGKFSVIRKKTGKESPDAEDAPFVQGRIELKGDWEEEDVGAGFTGKGIDGKSYSNSCGTEVTRAGGGFASSLSFEPQITSLLNNAKDDPQFVHTRLQPGEYLIYVRRGGVLAAWKNITVQAGDQRTLDFTIDLANTGSLVVTLPDEEVEAIRNEDVIMNANMPPGARVSGDLSMDLIPDGFPTAFYSPFLFRAGEAQIGEKTIRVTHVPAGKYKAICRKYEAIVEVFAGSETAVTLTPKN
jgi:hypothetical protein